MGLEPSWAYCPLSCFNDIRPGVELVVIVMVHTNATIINLSQRAAETDRRREETAKSAQN
ncbi:hypothetical protein IGI04_015453 [Brassica rapa subsp. trilocularis]|uniref:Uncharacterized protein n=1 Tax=Brassica rapa subsp. trilocularis TaxID=1813537 RepID=A0ABQ7MQ31_BRACM|nr:hypothetical protein IGI04_015453 [Brassica rapa subsp. trilocularis]